MSGDRTKLPKWAQEEFANLERRLAQRDARIAGMVAGEPSTAGVFRYRRSNDLDPISPSYPGDIYPTIQFAARPTKETYPLDGYLQANVHLDRDGVAWLSISGQSVLTLQCDSSNWIRVRIP